MYCLTQCKRKDVLSLRGLEAVLCDTHRKYSTNIWDTWCLIGELSKQVSSGGRWQKITRCRHLCEEKPTFKVQGCRGEKGYVLKSEPCVERKAQMKWASEDGRARKAWTEARMNCLETRVKPSCTGGDTGLCQKQRSQMPQRRFGFTLWGRGRSKGSVKTTCVHF